MTNILQNIPIGIDSITALQDQKCLFIDKSDKTADLVCQGKTRFYLSRPRRFGKTLLLSLLEELFARGTHNCSQRIIERCIRLSLQEMLMP